MLWKRCSLPATTITSLSATAALLLLLASAAPAQDEAKTAPAASSAAAEKPAETKDVNDTLKALQAAIDQQNLKLEMLTRELSLMRKKLDAMAPGGGPGESAKAEEKPAPAATEATAPAKENASKEPGAPEVRPAEATGGGVKHLVAKGETLTSIAKQYNIPVATLQKANKIQDGRKLQIGQVLSIPSTENPPEKKENP